MKTAQMKGARWALALVLALVCAAVIALPTLAMADPEPETAQVGEVSDKQGDEIELVTQAVVTLNGERLEFREGGSTFSAGSVASSINTLYYGGTQLTKGTDFSISGYQKTTTEGAPSESNLIGEPTSTDDAGNYYVIVSVNATYEDDHYTGWGYAQFTVEGSSGTPTGGQYFNVHFNGPSSFTVSEVPTKIEQTLAVQVNGTPVGSSDYTLSYLDSSHQPLSGAPSSEGTYYVLATGQNGYTGYTGDTQFTVSSANSLSNAKAETLEQDYIYTGQPITPSVSVTLNGKTLVQGTDYEIGGYANQNTGQVLASAPSDEGNYYVIINGKGEYSGSARAGFSIYVPTSISSNHNFTAKIAQRNYAYTGQPIVPEVTLSLDGVELVQGRDYNVKGYVKSGSDSSVLSSVTEVGQYRVVLEGIGNYSGEKQTDLFNIIAADQSNNLQYATIAFAKDDSYRGNNFPPTVEWANNKATPPAVVVTSAAGKVLEEGKDYQLIFKQGNMGGNPDNPIEQGGWSTSITSEGKYFVAALALSGSQYTSSNVNNGLEFNVASEAHDITKATVTMSSTFEYKDDAEILDTLKSEIGVTLGGKLTVDKDYAFSHRSPNNSKAGTGALGTHTLYLQGNVSANTINPQNITGARYYGMQRLSYGVWNDEAPAADQRVDLETGVKVTGTTISDNSTTEDEEWVSLDASKLADADMSDAAKEAKEASEGSGADEVLVYNASLAHSNSAGVSESMTEDLDIALSFPVDAKYNGKKATVTQIHDGKAMDAVTVTINNGEATVPTDCLSEFVIAISDEPAATDDAATTKASSADTSKTKLAATGDAVAPMAIGIIAVVALVAAGVMFAARRRERS